MFVVVKESVAADGDLQTAEKVEETAEEKAEKLRRYYRGSF